VDSWQLSRALLRPLKVCQLLLKRIPVSGYDKSDVWGCSLMRGERTILQESFARLSPVFAALGFALIFATAAPAKTTAEAAATATASVKRQSASTQFARAEEQRAALNSKPSEKRTLADYKQVVTVYRRVAMITPRAPEVARSLLAIAELYTENGRPVWAKLLPVRSGFLPVPGARISDEQILPGCDAASGETPARAAGRFRTVEKNIRGFLKRYPRSPRKREAQEALGGTGAAFKAATHRRGERCGDKFECACIRR